jgi:hypothetical protein
MTRLAELGGDSSRGSQGSRLAWAGWLALLISVAISIGPTNLVVLTSSANPLPWLRSEARDPNYDSNPELYRLLQTETVRQNRFRWTRTWITASLGALLYVFALGVALTIIRRRDRWDRFYGGALIIAVFILLIVALGRSGGSIVRTRFSSHVDIFGLRYALCHF